MDQILHSGLFPCFTIDRPIRLVCINWQTKVLQNVHSHPDLVQLPSKSGVLVNMHYV